jgi:hypothetical protein
MPAAPVETTRAAPQDPTDPPEPTPTRTRFVIAGLTAIVLGAAVVGNQLSGGSTAPEAPAGRPKHGTACPLLAEAFDLSRRGDEQVLSSTVKEAARVAEATLEISGQTYGAPERTALQLRDDIAEGDAVAVRAGLERAAAACSSIDRWPRDP